MLLVNKLSFGTMLSKYAIQASKKVYMQPSVILAQWAIESGWGGSGALHNNFANIEYSSNKDMPYSNGTYKLAGSSILYLGYATPQIGEEGYCAWFIGNGYLYKCSHKATITETAQALASSGWASAGYGKNGDSITETINANHWDKLYDKGYDNVAGNPNVKPTQSSTAIGTATPTSYIKRPQTFHKGLTPAIPVHSPSSIPTAKKKITSSAGSLAKGTKNNIDEPERTLKIASLSFVGIVAILFFIGHAFIPTETL